MLDFRKALMATAAALTLVVSTDDAKAVTLTTGDVGSEFVVNFNLLDTLLADFTWKLDQVVGSVWSFSVNVVNNSSNTPDKNRITSFGFGTAPSATSISITDGDGGVWNHSEVGTINGAGFQFFDLNACVGAGSNNCTGGGGGGVEGGGSSTVKFDLTAASNHLVFGDFASRWQSIDLVVDGNRETSIVFEGGVVPPAVIPLPAGGLLLITALGGLGFASRRRRKAA